MDVLGVDVLGVEVLGVDVLGVDVLGEEVGVRGSSSPCPSCGVEGELCQVV